MDEQQISCFLSLKNCRALFTVLRVCSHSSKSLTSIICLLPLVSTNKNKTSHNKTKPFMKSLQHLFPLFSPTSSLQRPWEYWIFLSFSLALMLWAPYSDFNTVQHSARQIIKSNYSGLPIYLPSALKQYLVNLL